MAAYLGMLGQLVVNEKMNDARRLAASWKLVVSVVSIAVGALPLAGAASVAVSAATGAGAALVGSKLAPDPERVRSDSVYGEDLTLTTLAAAITAHLASQWIAQGKLPDWYEAPPMPKPDAKHPSNDWFYAFSFWRERLPGGRNGPLGKDLTIAVYSVLGPYQVGALFGATIGR